MRRMPISENSLEQNISTNGKDRSKYQTKVEEIIFLSKQRSLYFLLKESFSEFLK